MLCFCAVWCCACCAVFSTARRRRVTRGLRSRLQVMACFGDDPRLTHALERAASAVRTSPSRLTVGTSSSKVHAQGDSFIPIAQEDGGCLNQAALDLFDEAARRAGGSPGETQAFRVFWRQRIAVANAKGVASTIRHRTPICSGAHWPLQPHHFSNLDLCPPARPTGTNSQNPRAAGDATTLTANG